MTAGSVAKKALEKLKKQKPPFIGGIAYPLRETRHTVGVRLLFNLIITDNNYLSNGNTISAGFYFKEGIE